MKIIERGQLAGDVTYRTRCRRCGTLYEFQVNEAQVKHDPRDGDYLLTTCPVEKCHQLNTTSVNAHAGSQWGR
jgi:hypothetical protein